MLALAATGFCAPAKADYFNGRLALHGFYTLEADLAEGHDVRLPSADDEPLVLEDGHVSLDSSVLGIQADLELADNLSLTGQMVSTKLIDDDLVPDVEWAYLSYDLGSDLTLRAGLRKVPFVQGTELRYVGFSRLWAKPIVPDSGASGYDKYVGVELTKSLQWHGFNVDLQGVAGKPDHQLDEIDGRGLGLVSARLEREQSWIRLALAGIGYDVSTRDGRPLKDDRRAYVGSIEAEWSGDNTILNGGLTYSRVELAPDDTMVYLSLGYRLGKWTPYLLLQDKRLRFDASEFPQRRETAPRGPVPPGPRPRPEPGPGGGAPPSLPNGVLKTQSFALGARFDLSPSTDIKIQFERQFVDDNSDLTPENPEYEANVFTLLFEGVF